MELLRPNKDLESRLGAQGFVWLENIDLPDLLQYFPKDKRLQDLTEAEITAAEAKRRNHDPSRIKVVKAYDGPLNFNTYAVFVQQHDFGALVGQHHDLQRMHSTAEAIVAKDHPLATPVYEPAPDKKPVLAKV